MASVLLPRASSSNSHVLEGGRPPTSFPGSVATLLQASRQRTRSLPLPDSNVVPLFPAENQAPASDHFALSLQCERHLELAAQCRFSFL